MFQLELITIIVIVQKDTSPMAVTVMQYNHLEIQVTNKLQLVHYTLFIAGHSTNGVSTIIIVVLVMILIMAVLVVCTIVLYRLLQYNNSHC